MPSVYAFQCRVRGWLTPGRKAVGKMQSLCSPRKGGGEFNTRAAQVHSLRFSGMRCKPAVSLNTKEVVEMKVTEQFTMRQLLLIIYGCVLLIVSVTMPCRALNRMALLGNKASLLYSINVCACISLPINVVYNK